MAFPDDPGTRVELTRELDLIRQIRARLGGSTVHYFGPPGAAPAALWRGFGNSGAEFDRSIFSSIDVPVTHELFFYVEKPQPGYLRSATFAKIKEYVKAVPEYCFRPDVYILPFDLSWCIVYTSEETRQGHLVIIIGDVPLVQ